MKIIRESLPTDVITIDRAQNILKGIIVQVFESKVSLLVPINKGRDDQQAGFFELGITNSLTCWNTISENRTRAMERVLNEGVNSDLYYFASLKDFCDTAIQRGWTFH